MGVTSKHSTSNILLEINLLIIVQLASRRGRIIIILFQMKILLTTSTQMNYSWHGHQASIELQLCTLQLQNCTPGRPTTTWITYSLLDLQNRPSLLLYLYYSYIVVLEFVFYKLVYFLYTGILSFLYSTPSLFE